MTKPESAQFDAPAHIFPVRVYWEDTDAGGVVYHASYVRFFERGRTEALRDRGLTQSVLRTEVGAAFVVRAMTIDFLRPGRMDDLLTIETRFDAATGSRLMLSQTAWRDEERIAAALVTCVCVGADGRPMRPPAAVTAALAQPQPPRVDTP